MHPGLHTLVCVMAFHSFEGCKAVFAHVAAVSREIPVPPGHP